MTTSDNDTDLDLLFAEARRSSPELPDDLAVRILTDAEAVRLERSRPAVPADRGLIRSLYDGLGGWQGLGGLMAASVAGVWVGFAAPSYLPDPASYFVSQDTSYLVANMGLEPTFLEELE